VRIGVGWKTAGVAVGTVALVTTTTGAAACTPGDGTTALRTASTSFAADVDGFDFDMTHAQIVAAEEHALAALQSWVAALQTKVADLGTPSTLTPRQAWKVKSTLAVIGFVRARLASLPTSGANALPAADVTTADSLDNMLADLAAKLRSVLANATIVHPTVKAADFKFARAHVLALRATRHHCDGFHWDGFHWDGGDRWRSDDGSRDRYRDGDRHYDGSYDGHYNSWH